MEKLNRGCCCPIQSRICRFLMVVVSVKPGLPTCSLPAIEDSEVFERPPSRSPNAGVQFGMDLGDGEQKESPGLAGEHCMQDMSRSDLFFTDRNE